MAALSLAERGGRTSNKETVEKMKGGGNQPPDGQFANQSGAFSSSHVRGHLTKTQIMRDNLRHPYFMHKVCHTAEWQEAPRRRADTAATLHLWRHCRSQSPRGRRRPWHRVSRLLRDNTILRAIASPSRSTSILCPSPSALTSAVAAIGTNVWPSVRESGSDGGVGGGAETARRSTLQSP